MDIHLDIIQSLKDRANRALKSDYTGESPQLGLEEVYTAICEWESCYKELKELKQKYSNLLTLEDAHRQYNGQLQQTISDMKKNS